MKKSNNYVGIDISKLSFDVAISNSENKYKHYKFSNNQEGFELFSTYLDKLNSICIMEAVVYII
jgi:transposase